MTARESVIDFRLGAVSAVFPVVNYGDEGN